ncbi:MAG TPA: MFS transporter [Candidatus Polarisedimenticolaceae bacterium]|nr:MFS transporter [Candidatus Polarisedimenticolaceae bacterium]
MPRNLKVTLRKIYLFCFLDDFVLLYPFYSIYMASKGLSVFQISTLLILWSVTDIITNIPLGVLADKYSRKMLLGIGQLLKALSFVPWIMFPSYEGFALGFVLWGIGGAFIDGTFDAVVYDELKAVNQEKQYVKVIGRAESFSLAGNLAATVLAGAAILLGYNFIFVASILAVVLSAMVVFRLPETPRFGEVADTRYFSMLRQGIKEAVHNRVILGIILLGGFIGAIYGSLEEFVPLFVSDTGVGLSVTALAVGATVAAAALGSLVAYRYEKLTTSQFMMLLGLSGALLLAAGVLTGVGGILMLVGFTFIIRMLQAIYDGKLQHSISGGLRATVSSVSGFAMEVLAISVYFAYGVITEFSDNFGAFAFFGGIVLLVALAYLLLAPRLLSRQGVPTAVS